MARFETAVDAARWRTPEFLWLDHAVVRQEDLGWMARARGLVLWNVRLPPGALARLPRLLGVSLRGGSAEDLGVLDGCTSLVGVDVNQILGLSDLGALGPLRSLERLDVYGQPRLAAFPSFAGHRALEQANLGSLKGLTSLRGVLDALALKALTLSRRVELGEADVAGLERHPTLRAFDWFPEDVPNRVWTPIVARLAHLEQARHDRFEDWLTARIATSH